MSGKTNWTPEQRQAIETVGTSLLVSAAAGSGKTSVLAERCVYLVCEAQDRCRINELLVVTFTEAAAAEMKKRITDRLIERANSCPESERRRLRGELMLIEQANISTLHSFCLRLIRQHFHRIDLDPAARVIDQDESALLRSEIIKEVFAQRYESGDEPFAQFIEAYGDGRDENLMELVQQTHALMESLVEPAEWRERAIRRIEQGGNLPLGESEMGREFLKLVEEDLDGLLRLTRRTMEQMPGEFGKYKVHLRVMVEEIESWQAFLAREYDVFVAKVKEFKPAKAPSYPESAGKADAKGAVDRIRKALDQFREWVIFSSQQWQDGLKAIQPHAIAFLSLVEDFAARYQKRKRELCGLDFADQERFALHLLRMPEVAEICRAQFKHVLVDEYQDINSVQEAILAAAGRGDNQFSVGDVKQSIYRFRLAEPGKFLEKSEVFGRNEGGKRIDLNCNFRSRAGLLDAINGVFRCLMTKSAAEIEYDSSHELNAGADYPAADEAGFIGVPIEMHLLEKQGRGESAEDELDRAEREALLIAKRIKEMVGKRKIFRKTGGGWEQKELRYSDIAVLLRATAHKADYFADALRQHDIPVQTDRGGGFFEAAEIRDMLALLELLDNQQQDVPLAAVLRSPIGGFDADALARIRLASPEGAFHRAVRMYAEQKKDELAERLNKFFEEVGEWRTLAQRRPLAEVVWKILTETGYLTFCGGLADGAQRQANLLHFHQRCKQYGKFGHGLYRFLRFVEKLKEEQETARPAASEVDEDSVRLMSIHAAKGLEFPVVFVPDLGKQHNLADMHGSVLMHRHAYLGLATADEVKQIRYPSLAQVLIRRKKYRETLAEELRLLYVAMTRAKEHLILIGTSELSAIETWERWAESTVMPAEQFLTGKTMLDWLGPAAAMNEKPGRMAIEIQPYSLAEIATWQEGTTGVDEFTDRQKQFAELRPMGAAADATAERIMSKLEYRYPYQSLTHIAAARSVSAVSKDGLPMPVAWDEEEEHREYVSALSPLRLPRWMQNSAQADAGEIGTATHRVLQHLKFSRANSPEEISRQMNEMISRRLLTGDEVSAVQTDSIVWLMGSPVGELLQKYSGKVIRELPIYFSCEPEVDSDGREGQAGDRVMLRGRLDAAIETEGGLILLDYKTDRVTAENIPKRAAGYERQIGMYCDALKRIGGKNVVAAYLVFLTPRVLQKV
jgi:ATP-dependent helicase/nuclease subunit A